MAAVAKTCQKLLMINPAIEFLSIGEVAPQPDWRMPMHSHPIHELIVVIGGRMKLETEQETLLAATGDILLYRAGMAHRETSDARHPVNTIFISFRAEDRALEGLPLRVKDAESRVRQMVSWMLHDQRSGAKSDQQGSLLQAILAESSRLCATPIDPWLTELREHMEENLTTKLSLADLAQQGGMSKFAFVRKFKRLSGRTPMQELQAIRLNQARTMLLASGLPVKAIAPAVGLTDEYQLSKLFRKHFKLSPTELRMRAR